MSKLPKLDQIIRSLQAFGRRYTLLLFVLVTAGAYGFLVFQINRLTTAEPTPEQISEQMEAVTRPRIDQTAVDRLNQLEAKNIEVQTLFDQARDNPFSE